MNTLIYVYDALCGWCYGFSPVMQQLHEKYSKEMDFTVLSGGMVTGERVGPIGQVAGYISEAYKTVEAHSGVQFGDGFLNGILKEGKAIFNSVRSGTHSLQILSAGKCSGICKRFAKSHLF